MSFPQPHAILLPLPAQGHLPALIHLARKLHASGILVTIVNIDSIHHQLLKKWNHPDITLEVIPFEKNPLPMGNDVNSQHIHFYASIEKMQEPFELLLKKLNPPPSCIIADEVIMWSRETARKFHVPSVSYFPSAASCSSVIHHLCLIASHGDLPLQDSRNELVEYIPGLSPVRPRDLPDYLHRMPKEHLQAYGTRPGQLRDATWVLVNSFEELEPLAFDAMRQVIGQRYVAVGPLFPLTCEKEQVNTSLRTEDETCISWLNSKPASSVLYISFGSCSDLSDVHFHELMHGIKASNQTFIWVVRPEMIPEDRTIYEQFVESSRNQGLVVEWAPQLKVLSHSSVGGFLTHCGWNSILESITNGVPLLGWPQQTDQYLNCKLMSQDFKVGLRLFEYDETPDRNNIEIRLRKFMDIEETVEIQKRVKELQNAAKRAAASGGSSYNNIQTFVNALKTSHT